LFREKLCGSNRGHFRADAGSCHRCNLRGDGGGDRGRGGGDGDCDGDVGPEEGVDLDRDGGDGLNQVVDGGEDAPLVGEVGGRHDGHVDGAREVAGRVGQGGLGVEVLGGLTRGKKVGSFGVDGVSVLKYF